MEGGLCREESYAKLGLVGHGVCRSPARSRHSAGRGLCLQQAPRELCNLVVHDVDVNRQTLFVALGKGRKDRIVPIGRGAASTSTRRVRASSSSRTAAGSS
jgi:hypothetical protein